MKFADEVKAAVAKYTPEKGKFVILGYDILVNHTTHSNTEAMVFTLPGKDKRRPVRRKILGNNLVDLLKNGGNETIVRFLEEMILPPTPEELALRKARYQQLIKEQTDLLTAGGFEGEDVDRLLDICHANRGFGASHWGIDACTILRNVGKTAVMDKDIYESLEELRTCKGIFARLAKFGYNTQKGIIGDDALDLAFNSVALGDILRKAADACQGAGRTRMSYAVKILCLAHRDLTDRPPRNKKEQEKQTAPATPEALRELQNTFCPGTVSRRQEEVAETKAAQAAFAKEMMTEEEEADEYQVPVQEVEHDLPLPTPCASPV